MESSIDKRARARIEHLTVHCACHTLRRTSRAVTHYYDALLKQPTGLRITQVTMLAVVYLTGPQTINQMAEPLDLDRTTLARNLKPLDTQGCLALRQAPTSAPVS